MVIMPGVLVFSSVKMCAGSAAGIYWIHGRKGSDKTRINNTICTNFIELVSYAKTD